MSEVFNAQSTKKHIVQILKFRRTCTVYKHFNIMMIIRMVIQQKMIVLYKKGKTFLILFQNDGLKDKQTLKKCLNGVDQVLNRNRT